MTRHFGLSTSGRLAPRGVDLGDQPSAARGKYAPRDSLPRLPPQSILHPEQVPHSRLDIGALLFSFGFFGAVFAFLITGFVILRLFGL